MKTIMTTWRSVDIDISYHEDWQDYPVIQLEVKAAIPLPIAETGHRKAFFQSDPIKKHGGIEAFVLLWLSQEAQKPEWQKAEAARKQYALL